MFRQIRRKLRQIEYYSAARPRTGWDRLTDASLFAALALAIISAWAGSAFITRASSLFEIHGKLGRQRGATSSTGSEQLVAKLVDRPTDAFHWGDLTPVAEFTLSAEIRSQGMPFPTARVATPPLLSIKQFTQANPTVLTRVQVDEETRAAIEDALAAAGRRDVLTTWRAGPGRPQRHLLGWIANLAAWWVAWLVALLAALHVVRVAIWLAQRAKDVRLVTIQSRQEARRRGNLCPSCGYDLRGLEFRARCPECGEIST